MGERGVEVGRMLDAGFYNMDCMEGMKQFPDKFFDLCLTDPPYGVGVEYGTFDDTRENLREFIKRFMPEILRVSKVTLLTCGNGNQYLYPEPDWTLAWMIPAGAGFSKWGFACWQPILAWGKDPYLLNKMGCRPDIVKITTVINENNFTTNHPCPKPLNLWENLVMRGSVKRTDKILDPFMGSGTTAIACHNLGRECWGFELDPDYYKAASERLAKAKAQVSLLDIAPEQFEQTTL